MAIKIKHILILFLFVPCSVILAQDTLNFQSFINRVKKYHPIILKANNIGAEGSYRYQAARGAYDPLLAGGYENKYFDSKNYYSVFDINVKQPIYTSQYISAGYEWAQGYSLNPENTTPKAGLPFLGFEMSLGQGLLIDKRRAEVLKASYYKDYYNAEKNKIYNEVLYHASNNYIDWIYTSSEYELQEKFTKLAQKRFMGIKLLCETGEAAAVDSVEAYILYQTRNIQLLNAEINKNKLKNILLTNLWQQDEQPTIAGSQDYINSESIQDCYALFFNGFFSRRMDTNINSPDIYKLKSLQSIMEVDLKYKAEMRKPKFDVKYNILSSKNPTTVFNTNNYKWGVSFNMPILLRTSRSEYQIAKFTLQNNSFESKNKSNQLRLKLSAIENNIKIILQQIDNAKLASLYSNKLWEAEKLKFSNGESSLFLLNTRETRWMESELKLLELYAKFMKEINEWKYTQGNFDF